MYQAFAFYMSSPNAESLKESYKRAECVSMEFEQINAAVQHWIERIEIERFRSSIGQ